MLRSCGGRLWKAALVAARLSGCVSVESDWAIASAGDSIPAYETFLKQHPDAEQAADASARVHSLRAQGGEAAAVAADTVEAYEGYLARYRNAAGASGVEARLRELRESQARDGAWAAAAESGERSDHLAFVERHPDSEQAVEARRRIERNDYGKALDRFSVEALDQYLSDHPESEHAAHVVSQLALARAIEEAEAVGTLEAFEAVVASFPDQDRLRITLGTVERTTLPFSRFCSADLVGEEEQLAGAQAGSLRRGNGRLEAGLSGYLVTEPPTEAIDSNALRARCPTLPALPDWHAIPKWREGSFGLVPRSTRSVGGAVLNPAAPRRRCGTDLHTSRDGDLP